MVFNWFTLNSNIRCIEIPAGPYSAPAPAFVE